MSNAQKLLDLFTATGLKKPKLFFNIPGVGGVSIAADFRRKGSWVNTGFGATLAFIDAEEGVIKFEQKPYWRKLATDQRRALVDALLLITSDLLTAARTYAHASNRCMFCGASLDDPRSVEHSYGPVCGPRYGLPWGGSKKEAEARVRKIVETAAVAVDAAS